MFFEHFSLDVLMISQYNSNFEIVGDDSVVESLQVKNKKRVNIVVSMEYQWKIKRARSWSQLKNYYLF